MNPYHLCIAILAMGCLCCCPASAQDQTDIQNWVDVGEWSQIKKLAKRHDIASLLVEYGSYDLPVTLLEAAVLEGETEAVAALLRKGNPYATSPAGLNPLVCAADHEREDILELLLAKGADTRATNREGFNALDIALQRPNCLIVLLLLRRSGLGRGMTPDSIPYLHYLLESPDGYTACLAEQLLKYGAVMPTDTAQLDRWMEQAISGNVWTMVELLDQYRPLSRSRRNQLLRYAYNDWEGLDFLLKKGVDIEAAQQEARFSFLESALLDGCTHCADRLVAGGAKLSPHPDTLDQLVAGILGNYDSDGLHWLLHYTKPDIPTLTRWLRAAIATGYADNVAPFLQYRADHFRDALVLDIEMIEPTFLHFYPDILSLLLEHGAALPTDKPIMDVWIRDVIVSASGDMLSLLIKHLRPDTTTLNGWLLLAAQSEVWNSVEQLLDEGASVHVCDTNGRTLLSYTALQWAVEDFESLVARLLKHPIPVNKPDKSGSTALHYALLHRNEENAQRLLEAGADYRLRDAAGRSALDLAIEMQHFTVIRFIALRVSDKADMEKIAWFAVEYKQLPVLQALQAKGLDLSQLRSAGGMFLAAEAARQDSPDMLRLFCPLPPAVPKNDLLFAATRHQNTEMVELLLEQGADARSMDSDSLPVVIMAAIHNNRNMVNLLLEHGADPRATDPWGHTINEILAWNTPVFLSVDEMPRFPLCTDSTARTNAALQKCSGYAMLDFINKHLQYPPDAIALRAEGLTVVSFIVMPNGGLLGFDLLKDQCCGLGEEALRLARLLGKQLWIPGKQGRNPVKVRLNIPIKFRLAH